MKFCGTGFTLTLLTLLLTGCGTCRHSQAVVMVPVLRQSTSIRSVSVEPGEFSDSRQRRETIRALQTEAILSPRERSIIDGPEILDFPPLLVSWTESAPDLPLPQEAGIDTETEGLCVPAAEAELLSFCRDIRTAPTWLVDDLGSLATWENAAFLSTAAGGAILLRNQVDDRVEQYVAEHPAAWGSASRVLNRTGEAVVHVPLLVGLYSFSLHYQDADLHELSLTMFASYKFTAITTLALQYGTDTRHGHYGGWNMMTDSGFPSMPTSTSFALAAVVDERYGWQAGIPCYIGAGLIGYAGIDQQQHHVSDVAFGAALGYAIGKSIGALHYRPDAKFKLIPFVDMRTGAQGMQIERQF
jgi:membrane-associated phospholipid phosphatase